MAFVYLFGSMIVFFALGLPIAVSIGLSSLLTILLAHLAIPLELVPRETFSGLDSFALMAIPFFVLGGELMNAAGLTTRIVSLAEAAVGHIRGSLAHVNIASSLLMAGVSGSGAADAAAIGTVMVPAMEEKGYPRPFTTALTAASSTVGPIVPPSVLFVIYGFLTNVSIGGLFVGGVIPGVVMSLSLMAIAAWVCRRRGYQQTPRPFDLRRLGRSALAGSAALVVPFIIVGSILTGFATATEAGVVAVAVAVVLGLVFYGTLRSVGELRRVVMSSVRTTSIIFFIIATSGLFGNILTRLQFQDSVLSGLQAVASTPREMLAAIVVALLVLGCFIDVTPLLIMFAAPLAHVGTELGFDPIYFGVVIVISATVGGVTPPVGGYLIVTSSVAKVPISAAARVLVPFVVALLFAIAVLIAFPVLVTFLPSAVLN